ncbi:MAG: diadenylate cyclase [Methanocalculaceae archaeon]|jgi:DNA integrity scanning protein DisA with diadenylate cyclase activity|nr:diadenylate cyclase [Methanocalculaceae archaeon]
MKEMERTLLRAADELARTAHALAIISFLDRDGEVPLTTPVVWVCDIQPEIRRYQTMAALVKYCSNHIIDAVVHYKILTKMQSGTVVAVFPYALLIYDIEDASDQFCIEQYADVADPDALHAVLSLALEIAREGREGRAIGTAFIIGDIEELKRWSHQGVLNPYAGHPEPVRDVRMKENWESVKEFAQLDGVFLIDGNGIIGAAGRYLDADGRDVQLQSGLGGRHLATAAITKVAPAVGITVSESGGVVRVFAAGSVVAKIRTDIRVST